jgi:hypothetical protein
MCARSSDLRSQVEVLLTGAASRSHLEPMAIARAPHDSSPPIVVMSPPTPSMLDSPDVDASAPTQAAGADGDGGQRRRKKKKVCEIRVRVLVTVLQESGVRRAKSGSKHAAAASSSASQRARVCVLYTV